FRLCTKNCPMSLDVNAMVRSGDMFSPECISCGACVDVCPKKVISFSGAPLKKQQL
ncbi:MAG: 4Fe-4S dicluster domain-containing protein, partial [Synergistales bacterium]|nr:4Fe-4S dicluster domain-containing protein [Synergistales bacterium]